MDCMPNFEAIRYLRSITIFVKEQLLGVIVHIRTSDTPRGSCITSLYCECKDGELSTQIFERISVMRYL